LYGLAGWLRIARAGNLILLSGPVPQPIGNEQELADAREHSTQRVRWCLLHTLADLREAHIESLPMGMGTCAGCHTREGWLRVPVGYLDVCGSGAATAGVAVRADENYPAARKEEA
jgi:hypothetical protein